LPGVIDFDHARPGIATIADPSNRPSPVFRAVVSGDWRRWFRLRNLRMPETHLDL
jgi:hypothetical protein